MFSRRLRVFGGRKEIEYLSGIVDNGTLRLAPDTLTVVRNRLLSKTQKHIMSFVQFFLMVIVFTITLFIYNGTGRLVSYERPW